MLAWLQFLFQAGAPAELKARPLPLSDAPWLLVLLLLLLLLLLQLLYRDGDDRRTMDGPLCYSGGRDKIQRCTQTGRGAIADTLRLREVAVTTNLGTKIVITGFV